MHIPTRIRYLATKFNFSYGIFNTEGVEHIGKTIKNIVNPHTIKSFNKYDQTLRRVWQTPKSS